MKSSREIMICAGEASGEVYGAALARELLRRNPDRHIFGMGGVRMQTAGVELIASMNPVVGVVEILVHVRDILRTLSLVKRTVRSRRPGLVVLIDNPEFNMRIAAVAKGAGIPVLYYVSPQVWAWRKGRAQKIARTIDGMAVILPFEKAIYEALGVRTVYTGHPMIEEIHAYVSGSAGPSLSGGTGRSEQIMAVLPGSRRSEIALHTGLLEETVRLLRQRIPHLTPVIPVAPGLPEESRTRLLSLERAGAVLTERSSWDVFREARVALVASGTASLEAALFGVPTVVFYRLNRLSYLIGKWLIDVPHISLANLLLEERVIPEYVQDEATPFTLASAVERLDTDEIARNAAKEAFGRVRTLLGGISASARAADLAEEMAA